jgi:hypothetical protein
MHRMLYLCDWLPPDFGAVGQYALLFARQYAGAGAKVTLIGLSTQPHRPQHEQIGKGYLQIIRIPCKTYDKNSLPARIRWILAANSRLLLALLRYGWGHSHIKFTGSPPLFLHWLGPLNLFLRKHLTYRITDFYPECYIAAKGTSSPLLRLLQSLTWFWRRRISQFEVLGKDQQQYLLAHGIPPHKIILSRDLSPVSISPRTPILPRPQAFAAAHYKLLLYSGNWGIAHDSQTFLRAYQKHHRQGSGHVILWLNAQGTRATEVQKALEQQKLPFIPGKPVPLCELAALLHSADAHLISLHNNFTGFVMPSKIYGCLASGKPILFIGSRACDIDLLCRGQALSLYRRVDVGDVESLYEAFDELGQHHNRSGI